MDFELSPDHLELARSMTRLLGEHYSFARRCEVCTAEPGWNAALWQQLSALGVTALGIPESRGGLGGSLGNSVDLLPIQEVRGRALLVDPFLTSVVLGATAARHAGDDDQCASLLPGVASGAVRLAWAHDEVDNTGTGLSIGTTARPDADGWRLTGAKTLVLFPTAADWFIVSASVREQADTPGGPALFLVDSRDEGLQQRHYRLVDDTPAGDLSLEAVKAEPLGNPLDGQRASLAIRATLAAGTAAACADMLGSMEGAYGLTVEYAKLRTQFGHAIGENQALRHRIADMFVALEFARTMAMSAAYAADAPDSPDARVELSRAKFVVGRNARSLCEAAIQIHGGIGMTQQYPVGHYLHRVHVFDHLFGDSVSHSHRLASAFA